MVWSYEGPEKKALKSKMQDGCNFRNNILKRQDCIDGFERS